MMGLRRAAKGAIPYIGQYQSTWRNKLPRESHQLLHAGELCSPQKCCLFPLKFHMVRTISIETCSIYGSLVNAHCRCKKRHKEQDAAELSPQHHRKMAGWQDDFSYSNTNTVRMPLGFCLWTLKIRASTDDSVGLQFRHCFISL